MLTPLDLLQNPTICDTDSEIISDLSLSQGTWDVYHKTEAAREDLESWRYHREQKGAPQT
jgi:hypothetical protein